MTHIIQVTDAQYEALARAAQAEQVTPEDLFARWIDDLRRQHPGEPYYETEEWFRHLGASEEQIAEARRIARERSEREHANP